MKKLPQTLILEITRQCNFHCPWCYCVWHEKPEIARRNLSAAAWERIISQAVSCGVKSFMFTGGEVTCRHDWHRILAFSRTLSDDLSLTLFSNGSRFSDDDLLFLKQNRILLTMSLPGLNTYGIMTGTKRNCRMILELFTKLKTLHWSAAASITINRMNRVEAADILNAALSAGAACIQVNPMMQEGKARRLAGLSLAKDEWEELKQILRRNTGSSASALSFSDEMTCICRDSQGRNHPFCPAGKQWGVIGPSGFYRTCIHMTDEICHWKTLLNTKE